MEKTAVLERNPIIFKNDKQERLEEAKKLFLSTLTEFAKMQNLSEDEYTLILKYINEAYLEKKASYLLQERINELSSQLDHALKFALAGSYKTDTLKDSFTKVFYYRNKRSSVSYER